jgi:hypothetical protein
VEIPEDRIVFAMRLRVNSEGSARPEEVLRWLLERDIAPKEIVRVSLSGPEGEDPLAPRPAVEARSAEAPAVQEEEMPEGEISAAETPEDAPPAAE